MRTQTERKMRSTRIGQTKLKKCMKWTASGLLLAVMFALVFAGTLSGAFGIEENLQQNGIIENNVASAAWKSGFQGSSLSEGATIASDENGVYYLDNETKKYFNANVSAYSNITGDHSIQTYFTSGTEGKADGARVYVKKANDSSPIYIGWSVVFSDSLYYAILNDAVSKVDFKVNSHSPSNEDHRQLKI